jgi:integrase
MTLLGGILQRAAESKRIDFNPQRVVRKARLPQPAEVRPLTPTSVEAMRAVLPQRDATIVSTLAYAGLRPGELRALRWRHLGERTLPVYAEKTGHAEVSARSPPYVPISSTGEALAGIRRRTTTYFSPPVTARGAPTRSRSGAAECSRRLCKRPDSSAPARPTSGTLSRRCCSTRAGA